MSIPALCELLNGKGYKTNYGALYDAGRGSYRLVRSVYHRNDETGRTREREKCRARLPTSEFYVRLSDSIAGR
jgi:hypothetical protein